jgi:hypothetical protein
VLSVLLPCLLCCGIAAAVSVSAFRGLRFGDPVPPPLVTQESDLHRVTGGRTEQYPPALGGFMPGPSDPIVERALDARHAGDPAGAYVMLKRHPAAGGNTADAYIAVATCYRVGRYAEAYPAARALASARVPVWPTWPKPGAVASDIETLAVLLPESYTVRDSSGVAIYCLYVNGDNTLARRLAPTAPEAFEAAVNTVLGDRRPPADVLPIPVYLPTTYADWEAVYRTAGGDKRPGEANPGGFAHGLSIVGRAVNSSGRETWWCNDIAAQMLAHETAHVMQCLYLAYTGPAWLNEGEADIAGAVMDPEYGSATLASAAYRVARDPAALRRAIAALQEVDADYSLYYALACYTREEVGLARYRALMCDKDLTRPGGHDDAYRRQLGMDSRDLCTRTAEWLQSERQTGLRTGRASAGR